jgi:hypothetical protein
MKNAIVFALSLVLILGFTSCKKCKNEDPRARIVNNGTDKVSVQIMTSGGNTENINNILAGTESAFVFYAPGVVQFTIAFQSNTDTTFSVQMIDCWEYDIVIDANDRIVSTPVDRNE